MIQASQLPPAMATLLSKLHSLLRPITQGGDFSLPLLSEINVATELLSWMHVEIERLNTERKTTLTPSRWPNVNVWSNFINGLKGLDIPNLTSQNATPAYNEALTRLTDSRNQLTSLAEKIMKAIPGGVNNKNASKAIFLPTDAQRHFYKDKVLTYYNNVTHWYTMHKEQMVCLAAMYQAIATRIGLDKREFFGPDFDDFIFNYCGIKYNASATPRGRYRAIQQVREGCVDAIGTQRAISSDMRQLFFQQLKHCLELLGPMEEMNRKHAFVPKRWDER